MRLLLLGHLMALGAFWLLAHTDKRPEPATARLSWDELNDPDAERASE